MGKKTTYSFASACSHIHAGTHAVTHTHIHMHTHKHAHTIFKEHALWLELFDVAVDRENKKDLGAWFFWKGTLGGVEIKKCCFPPHFFFFSTYSLKNSHGFERVQILQGAVDLRKDRNQFYLELLHELVSESSRVELESHLSQITCPVQVVWGQQDEVS